MERELQDCSNRTACREPRTVVPSSRRPSVVWLMLMTLNASRGSVAFFNDIDPLLPVELKASGPSWSSLYDQKQTLAPRPQSPTKLIVRLTCPLPGGGPIDWHR